MCLRVDFSSIAGRDPGWQWWFTYTSKSVGFTLLQKIGNGRKACITRTLLKEPIKLGSVGEEACGLQLGKSDTKEIAKPSLQIA